MIIIIKLYFRSQPIDTNIYIHMQHGKMYTTIVSKISNAFLEMLVHTTKHLPENWLLEKRRPYREICKQRTRQVVGWEAAGGFLKKTDCFISPGMVLVLLCRPID